MRGRRLSQLADETIKNTVCRVNTTDGSHFLPVPGALYSRYFYATLLRFFTRQYPVVSSSNRDEKLYEYNEVIRVMFVFLFLFFCNKYNILQTECN